MLESQDDMQVVGEAEDGAQAIAMARDHLPDVLSLDVNMPGFSGLEVLKLVLSERICPVVMVSSLTQENADTTLEALSIGAFDCVAKPSASRLVSIDSIKSDYLAKVRAASQSLCPTSNTKASPPLSSPKARLERSANHPQAIFIGISTGGPTTIQSVLQGLAGASDATIYLVQHMPVNFTASFARRLEIKCGLEVREAQEGMEAEGGVCYVAQGGLHMIPQKAPNGRIRLHCSEEPEEPFMPSANRTLSAVTKLYGPDNTVGVIMTGIGNDGVDALLDLKLKGGYTIAESEESCVAYGMPKAAYEANAACDVLPKEEVAEAILNHLAKEAVS